MVIVVDTSALIGRLIGLPRKEALARRLDAPEWHAPHLLDVECVHALRRLVRTGLLSADRATDLLAEIRSMPIVRYPHELLAARMWELRDNLSAYDAAFVVLAEVLGAPLVTTDARLAHAPGHRAHIELF